jgi:hypothetical protein
MRMIPKLAAALMIAAVLFCGCTTDQFSRNIYDGAKNRDETLRSAPRDDTVPRAAGYDEYERERRGL